MLDEQEGNFARLQLACSDGIRSPECVAGLGWERGRQSAAALRLFLGCTTNSYSPFFAALRLQLLPEVASDFPLGPKNNLVQKAHAAACWRAAGRGQLHETLQTC